MTEEKVKVLRDMCNRMSFLLGMATGGLHQIMHEEKLMECEPLNKLLKYLENGIDHIYYETES